MSKAISIIFRPWRGISITSNSTMQLVVLLIIMELFITLLSFERISISLDRSFSQNPMISPSMKPVIFGILIIILCLIRIGIICFISSLFTIAMNVLGQKNRFSNVFYIIALSTIPLFLGRVLQNTIYISQHTAPNKENILSLYSLLGNYSPFGLENVCKLLDPFDLWALTIVLFGLTMSPTETSKKRAFLLALLLSLGTLVIYLRGKFILGGIQ